MIDIKDGWMDGEGELLPTFLNAERCCFAGS